MMYRGGCRYLLNRTHGGIQRGFCSAEQQTPVSNVTPWKLFFNGCRKHKYKLLFFSAGISTIIFRQELSAIWKTQKTQASQSLQKSLSKEKELTKIVEAFLIRTILDVLASPEVLNNSLDFTTQLINNPDLQKELIKFLIAGLQHPQFLEEAKKLGINLVLDVLKDKDVQTDLLELLAVVLSLLHFRHCLKMLSYNMRLGKWQNRS
jgi:uncharacterized protein YjgD (DUF1641 family)